MRTHRSTFQKLAFSTFLLSLSLNSAFAQDTEAVAERLKTLLSNQGMQIDWTRISGSPSDMVLQGVSLKSTSQKGGLSVGDITLEGIEDTNGGYSIESLSTAPFSRTEDGATIELSPFVMHGLTLPAENDADPMSSLVMYKSAELANLAVKIEDKTAFSMDNTRIDVIPPADGKALEFTGTTEKFTGDLSLVKDPKSGEVINALGYQTVTGNMGFAGSWNPTDGTLELTKNEIAIDNAGKLGFTFNISGYTLDFIKSMQEMQKKMGDQPEGADKSTQGMAMLGLMQQLTFNGMTIRFDDDSLTAKALAYAGKQQGMMAKDIANQVKAIIPFGMAQLDNPELTAQVSAAVGKFLDDPKSLEISAKPTAPTPFALIMAAGMTNPLTLTKTLGLTVTANED